MRKERSWSVSALGAVVSGLSLVLACGMPDGSDGELVQSRGAALDGVIALTDGVPVANLSGAAGSTAAFKIAVPSDRTSLTLSIHGGTGNADLYVRFRSPPAEGLYQCAPRLGGNDETCTIHFPAAGDWYAVLEGRAAYSGVTLVATSSQELAVTALANGVPVSGLSGAVGSQAMFKIAVPGGRTSITVRISGGAGDADLYVRSGAPPTMNEYQCAWFNGDNEETCTLENPAAGDWYVMVNGYLAYSGVTLVAEFLGPASQLLANPDFEDGAAGWTQSSELIRYDPGNTHGGDYLARLNGYGASHTDYLYQEVFIPSGATSAVLSFWLRISTAEETRVYPLDVFNVEIRDTSNRVLTLATYSNLDAGGYVQRFFDVAPYRGQAIRVYFVGQEDPWFQTTFFVDDTALNVQ